MDPALQWPSSGNSQSAFAHDISGYRETLRLNAKRIFVGHDALDIEACIVSESRCPPKQLQSPKELEAFLDVLEDASVTSRTSPSPTASIFFLRQKHSRASIAISEAAMMLLLSRLHISPAFVNIMTSFGSETGPYSDGCSNFYAHIERIKSEASVFETAYILKHVENHRRPDSIMPFSIRQMGVCQRYEISAKLSSCVLIQTSDRVQNRISELVKDGHIARFPHHWTFLHMIYLGTLGDRWTAYIRLLDSNIEQIDHGVRFAEIGTNDTDRVTFTDLQQLNKLSDLLIRVIHALQLNLDVLEMLSREAVKRANLEGDEQAEQYDEFQSALSACTTGHTFLRHHAHLVRENAQRIATQLRDTIAIQDSNGTLTMTRKTIQEARTMTTITFVALVYLPASFVCAFLSMGFIHVESLGGVMQLSTNKDLWLFFAIAAPLMLITLLGWGFWEMQTRRRRKKHENGEKLKDV